VTLLSLIYRSLIPSLARSEVKTETRLALWEFRAILGPSAVRRAGYQVRLLRDVLYLTKDLPPQT